MPTRDYGDVRVIEDVLAEHILAGIRDTDTDPEGFWDGLLLPGLGDAGDRAFGTGDSSGGT